jgi:hypothetical protein
MLRILSILTIAGFLLSLPALTYEGPVEVARFYERAPNGLGFIREGAGHGPLRLLVSDTTIFLLARLDHKFLAFDLSGNVKDSIHLPFCPADVTYDSKGDLWFLQSRVEPGFISTYFQGQETARMEFPLKDSPSVTEVCMSPVGDCLLLSAGFAYKLVPVEEGQGNKGAKEPLKYRLLPVGERPGRYLLTDSHIGRVTDTWEAEFTGKTAAGSVPAVQLEPLDRELFQFHADDRLGRLYIVGTSIQTDDEGNKYITRRLIVIKDGKILAEIAGLEPGSSSYDYANHDIAIAPSGDVYLFRTHLLDDYSQILLWKAKE